MEPYIAKSKKWILLVFIIPCAGLVFFGLDIHFFHTLESTVPPDHPSWIVLCVVGVLLLAATIKGLLSPATTLLKADSTGITVYSGGSAKTLDDKTHSFVLTRKKGDAKTIPWSKVVSIEQGVLYTGFGRVQGENTTGKAKALKVLCRPDIELDGFEMVGISKTWNGFDESDLRTMTKEERNSISPDDLKSGLLFNSMHLKGSLQEVIVMFRKMHKQFGQQLPPRD